MSRWSLHRGDCLEWLRSLPDASADSLVTDPPAGIGFMNRGWDSDRGGRARWVEWLAGVLAECLRVLKPGAHALVWALPRTSHWTGCAVEDAGFEVRDRIAHLFGTGYPKSLNVGGGFGTGLKPAAEDWWLGRKPCAGTVRENLLRHGTGALNVDACRIGVSDADREALASSTAWARPADAPRPGVSIQLGINQRETADVGHMHEAGRWPANLVLSHSEDCKVVGALVVTGNGHWPSARGVGGVSTGGHAGQSVLPERSAGDIVEQYDCAPDCAVRLLDEQSGDREAGGDLSGDEPSQQFGGPTYSDRFRKAGPWRSYGDSGGASRFYYVAKPSTAERDAGCEHLLLRSRAEATGRKEGSAGASNPRAGAGAIGGRRNVHPTCKSVDLMRWLVRLVTPPGGLVVDPFAGSASTGCAAMVEGMRFAGAEMDSDYATIAEARLRYAESRPVGGDYVPRSAPAVLPGQLGLFGDP